MSFLWIDIFLAFLAYLYAVGQYFVRGIFFLIGVEVYGEQIAL